MPFGISFNLKHVVGKTQVRSQLWLLGTDDGREIEKEIPVASSASIDNATCQGYLIDGDNQYRNEINNHWYQIGDEKSGIPICLLRPEKAQELEGMIDGLFHQSWTQDLAVIDRESQKERQKAILYFILAIAVIFSSIIAAMSAFK